ncbi:PREDICTED: histone-lysine N-methyltransferase 2C-like [Elephantulus edwardii]|uniref:histone-lysine N-methyltransferase 2C-like n=1 Tax=Elephantulus edwardii TaxID=28737 RepID=UPI0003F061B4|nr:PREDICTED: histone-lysine N-methyltransferase 2C-like [Elephantulus edwardii]
MGKEWIDKELRNDSLYLLLYCEAEIKEQSAEEDAEAEMDNKPPVPLLQNAVSEESATAMVSVGVEAKIRLERGSKRLNVSDENNGQERSPQGVMSHVSVSTQTASDDQAGKLWDELSLVGLPDAIDVQALFDSTGTCWAHHRCVEWSLGVCQMEEPLLVNVDKAVVSGSTEGSGFLKKLVQNSTGRAQNVPGSFCYRNDVHFVSTLEPLSNAVKRNVLRYTIILVLRELAPSKTSVTSSFFVQNTLTKLLKDQRKMQTVQCATARETS